MKTDIKYLKLLSRSFPTIQAASTEIINLQAIMNLPKGTEHFLSDVHGEYDAFDHVLRNASGVIKAKVEDIFGCTLSQQDKRELCTLIYYPEEKLKLVRQKRKSLKEWYKTMLSHLVEVCAVVSSKYTRSKVRKALPAEYSYIIQELLHESKGGDNKHEYITAIIETIISTGRAEHFIVALSNVIQRLTIDTLHIVGDIYDRGPAAHKILDKLSDYHNYDIQWGNHDILWMGAACGSKACLANVLRICFRYANLRTLEEGYGVNLMPLITFAMRTYENDPCSIFHPKRSDDDNVDSSQLRLITQMHKAITIIQFKLEGRVIHRHPEFAMDDRLLLNKIDYENGLVTVDGVKYKLKDADFPTVDPSDPYRLTDEEEEVMEQLIHSFVSSPVMQKHMKCFFNHGSLYKVSNNNLLFHAAVPVDENGEFKELEIMGKRYKGKALFDKIDSVVRLARYDDSSRQMKQYAKDFLWYLWCGPIAPPFDKDKMATFERYYLDDAVPRREVNGYYSKFKEDKTFCEKVLKEFGIVGPHSHIVNGHVPVKTIKGEHPVKAGGKLLVIDGGFSRAYQKETGIAGYTLTFNSHCLKLVQHEPFESRAKAIEMGKDIISDTTFVEPFEQRMMVKSTDIGAQLSSQIEDLKALLKAYRNGEIPQA